MNAILRVCSPIGTTDHHAMDFLSNVPYASSYLFSQISIIDEGHDQSIIDAMAYNGIPKVSFEIYK